METLKEIKKELEKLYSITLEESTKSKLEELWKISLLEDFIDKSKYTIYIQDYEPVIIDKDGIINEEETNKIRNALKMLNEIQEKTEHLEHLFSISGLNIMDKSLIYVLIYNGASIKTVTELKKEMNKYELCRRYDEDAIELEINDKKIYYKIK